MNLCGQSNLKLGMMCRGPKTPSGGNPECEASGSAETAASERGKAIDCDEDMVDRESGDRVPPNLERLDDVLRKVLSLIRSKAAPPYASVPDDEVGFAARSAPDRRHERRSATAKSKPPGGARGAIQVDYKDVPTPAWAREDGRAIPGSAHDDQLIGIRKCRESRLALARDDQRLVKGPSGGFLCLRSQSAPSSSSHYTRSK